MRSLRLFTAGFSEAEKVFQKDGWEVTPLVGSHPETPLTRRAGNEHARLVGRRLDLLHRRGDIDDRTRVLASGEDRAVQTLGAALGETALTQRVVDRDPRLNEQSYGSLRGRAAYRWTFGNSPPEIRDRRMSALTESQLIDAGGETLGQVTRRMRDALDDAASQLPDGGACVIVSHLEAISLAAYDIAGVNWPGAPTLPRFTHATETLITEADGNLTVEHMHLPLANGPDPPLETAYWRPPPAQSFSTKPPR